MEENKPKADRAMDINNLPQDRPCIVDLPDGRRLYTQLVTYHRNDGTTGTCLSKRYYTPRKAPFTRGAEVRADFAAGMTRKALANKYGISLLYVNRALAETVE